MSEVSEPGVLAELGADVDWTDGEAATAARQALSGRAGLGRLGALAEWAAAVRPVPPSFTRPRLVLVGSEVPADVAELAADLGVSVRDVPVDAAEESAAGEQIPAAARAGGGLADVEADSGTDLLIVATPLLGAAPRVITAVVTNTEPVKVMARGAAATDPEAWMRLTGQIRDERRAALRWQDDPDRLLRAVGTPALAFATGLVLRAATRRTPAVLAGGGALVAALLAYEAHPRAVRWWAAADADPEPDSSSAVGPGGDPVPRLISSRLGLNTVLSLGTGEDPEAPGLVGVLSVPVLRAAARVASRIAGI